MSDELVTIATYDDPAYAHIVQAELESARNTASRPRPRSNTPLLFLFPALILGPL